MDYFLIQNLVWFLKNIQLDFEIVDNIIGKMKVPKIYRLGEVYNSTIGRKRIAGKGSTWILPFSLFYTFYTVWFLALFNPIMISD